MSDYSKAQGMSPGAVYLGNPGQQGQQFISPESLKKQSQVEEELSRLETVLSNAEDKMHDLHSRLSPVLLNEAECIPPASLPQSSLVPLAEAIRMQRFRAERISDFLSSFLTRMQL